MAIIKIEKDGRVKCGLIEICPLTTLNQFEKSPMSSSAKKVLNDNGWMRFQIKAEMSIVSLIFCEEQLSEVHITLIDPSVKSWADWSEELETRKKQQHDEILRQCLGNGPYQFTWGEVDSIIDIKGGGSEIIVRYASIPKNN